MFDYDAAGQLIASSRGHNDITATCNVPAGNSLANYSYDDLSQLETTTYADANTGNISRKYDDNGNLEKVSRGIGTSNENIWDYTYNDLNLLTSEILSIDGRTFPMTYSYNAYGYMDDGMIITTPAYYDIDALGRQTKLHSNHNNANRWSARNVTYHPNGMVKHMDYANGHNFDQTLNARQQLETLRAYRGSNATVDLSYSYDGRGLISSITDLLDANESRTFGYDGQGRMTTATGPWGNGNYTYDALGNIRSKTFSNWKGAGARTVNMSYDNTRNRITGYTDTAGSDRLVEYDSRGNVDVLGSMAFIYDGANQPYSVTGGSYVYDGNFKRVKAYNAVTQETIYNVFNKAGKPVHVEAIKANGSIYAKTYRYIAGKRITRFFDFTNQHGGKGYNNIYFHEDHLGSPLVSSNPTGSIRWRESYSPFGEGMVDPSDNKDQPGFTGHIKDAATGLNYMQARYYDPVMGRFLSEDPVTFLQTGDAGQFNRYAYASNDPVNKLDPDGNDDIFVGGQGDSGPLGSNIVKNYEKRWAGYRPGRTTSYRGFNNQRGIVKDLKAAAKAGGPVNLTCHSRGCAHAMSAIKTSGIKVDNLVSVDPVNAGVPFAKYFDGQRPENIANWTNVEGTPTEGNHNSSDRIEGIGEAISGGFDTSGADTQISTTANHGNFGQMFNSSSNSTSSGSSKFDKGYTILGSRIRRND